ncbi:hypothetical protein [Terracoccus sp. 273MFTsu3.1]|uniref:hypothetical protein n=1 Tax=Terracoccus sp. 273MFTsu3.1 TaxID=1172188 RepID=UPI00036392E1|nr:hypothetical protein [Terracoccus sp. 273MFTsu3.1]
MPDPDPYEHLPADLRREAQQAAVDKARAEADKATADAAKARADADQARATADKTTADNEAAQRSTAVAATDATNLKTAAEAERDAAAARTATATALVPDLSKLEKSALTVTGDPVRGVAVSTFALGAAATEAAKQVTDVLPDDLSTPALLVTTDPELAAGDAVYWQVLSTLAELRGRVRTVLDAELSLQEPGAQEAPGPGTTRGGDELGPGGVTAPGLDVTGVGAAVAAVAKLVPGVLNLFVADRTVATSAVTHEDSTCAVAVVGALAAAGCTVSLDTFRTLGRSPLQKRLGRLAARREDLAAALLRLATAKAEAATAVAEADRAVASARSDLAELVARPPVQDSEKSVLEDAVETARLALAAAQEHLAAVTLVADKGTLVLAQVDAFLVSVAATPAPGRSAWATARMLEWLHLPPRAGASSVPEGRPITHVVLVRAGKGDVTMTTSNRALWLADRFSTDGTQSLSYLCLDVSSNTVLAAGVVARTGVVGGKLGRTQDVANP